MPKTKTLTLQGLNKKFDGIEALTDFSAKIEKQEILGLIGPNGAGKSTLFNVITGFIPPDSGTAEYSGDRIIGKYPHEIARLGIARTFQDMRLIRQMKVMENILLCFQTQPGEKLAGVFFNKKHWQNLEKQNRAKAIELLEYAGIADKAGTLAGELSYGQQKLLSIICCLAADAQLLLLDEPVAGLNPAMIEKILAIIEKLPEQGKSVILIEHNMDAVLQVCHRVIFMDAGKKVSEGTPQQVRNDSRVIKAYLD